MSNKSEKKEKIYLKKLMRGNFRSVLETKGLEDCESACELFESMVPYKVIKKCILEDLRYFSIDKDRVKLHKKQLKKFVRSFANFVVLESENGKVTKKQFSKAFLRWSVTDTFLAIAPRYGISVKKHDCKLCSDKIMELES